MLSLTWILVGFSAQHFNNISGKFESFSILNFSNFFQNLVENPVKKYVKIHLNWVPAPSSVGDEPRRCPDWLRRRRRVQRSSFGPRLFLLFSSVWNEIPKNTYMLGFKRESGKRKFPGAWFWCKHFASLNASLNASLKASLKAPLKASLPYYENGPFPLL